MIDLMVGSSFMPDATNSARMDIIEIGAKSVVENHAEWETVVGEHVAVAVATSKDIVEVFVSMEWHICLTSNDSGCEYFVPWNVRHDWFVIVVDGVFDCSGNMGLGGNRNRIRRFCLYRDFVNGSFQGSRLIPAAVESMLPREYADKDEERRKGEKGPSAEENEQRAKDGRRIAQNGQNRQRNGLYSCFPCSVFAHTSILRAEESYTLIA